MFLSPRMSGTCEYVTLQCQEERSDMIKVNVLEMRRFSWIFQRGKSNHFLKVEEKSKRVGRRDAKQERYNLPLLALKMKKESHEARSVGSLQQLGMAVRRDLSPITSKKQILSCSLHKENNQTSDLQSSKIMNLCCSKTQEL